MNNLSKNFKDDEGKEGTLIASSTDNYEVKLDKTYSLANRTKENTFVKKFKGSILGQDIGIKSKGFSSVAALAIVLVLAALITMYFLWRF